MAKDNYKQYAKAFFDLMAESKPEHHTKNVNAFINLLAKHQKLKQAPLIINEFERLSKKAAGIVTLNIVSAHALGTKALEQIKKMFGSNVEETVSVDPSLLGGVKIQTDEKIFDATLKTQLINLSKALNQ